MCVFDYDEVFVVQPYERYAMSPGEWLSLAHHRVSPPLAMPCENLSASVPTMRESAEFRPAPCTIQAVE